MAANVIFRSGTRAAYDGATKNDLTFYRVSENDGSVNLYLGTLKISNDADLQAALERIAANETDIDTNASDIAKLRQDLEALTGDSEGSISDQIDELENSLNAKIVANQTAIGENKSAIEAEVVRAQGAESTLQESITNLTKTVNDNEIDIEAKVKANTDNIASHAETLDSHDSFIQALQAKDIELTNAINTEKARINTLVDGDGSADGDETKSVRAIAAEETAKIVAGADENYDTLKEIADWITNDTTGAADMANDIKALQTLTENQGALITDQGTRLGTAEGEIDDLQARMNTAEGNITQLGKDIDAVEQSVAAINDSSTGILAKANKYTDDEVAKLAQTQSDALDAVAQRTSSLENRAENIEDDIAAINDSSTGILATANNNLQTLKDLLKSAAYEEKSYFENDATTKANAAKNEAIAHSNSNLEAAKAYTDSCLTWQSI